ncbi:MAG: prolyl oligopeptidase family serine peptidase [Streptosporangiaceae bacterium]
MTLFRDLHDYVAIPRLTALRLAPDGSWLAATVQTMDAEGKKFVSSIWRIDTRPAGPGSQPARLTRSAEGEGSPAFLPDGSLLFVSKRPEPAAGPAGQPPGADPARDKPALWLLPAAGGEASRITAPPGGVTGLATARDARIAVFASPALPGSAGPGEDASRRQQRKDAGVTAILHESGAVRYWDHDLGPDSPRLQAAEIPGPGAEPAANGNAPAAAAPRDLTPCPGRALDNAHFELTPDGSLAVTGWAVWDTSAAVTEQIAVITVATGERRTLLAAPGLDFGEPRVSPDGTLVACLRAAHDSYDGPGDVTLVVTGLDGTGLDGTGLDGTGLDGTGLDGTGLDGTGLDGTGLDGAVGQRPRDLLAGLDRRPLEAAWAPDSASVYFTADDHGRCPVFRVDLATAEITRLTTDDGAYSSLCPAPDGRWVYALRASVDEPPAPVRLAAARPGLPDRLASPAGSLELPGTLTEVRAAAADGAAIRGWLVLPAAASADTPAALLLWVHGGPVMSWNSWSWRWNPWLMAARGYAVLLPDPALSTGYGHEFIARGHGRWGEAPFTDLMAITDAAAARPDIDATRTAMMGGSFGGYMANWIAGHTGRFSAIVSHAGLWALDQMFATTDLPSFWRRQFGDPAAQPGRYLANSPNLHLASIRTPMLVIHGDKDYRVPIGEALRLWADLSGRAAEAKFLYFPDENHWILTPGNVVVWYETVLAFLAQHVLGEPWRRPELL